MGSRQNVGSIGSVTLHVKANSCCVFALSDDADLEENIMTISQRYIPVFALRPCVSV